MKKGMKKAEWSKKREVYSIRFNQKFKKIYSKREKEREKHKLNKFKKQEPNWRKRSTTALSTINQLRLIQMGQEQDGKKKKGKAQQMSRGKGSDFEMIEGEGILRVRNKNQAKTGKK